MELDVDGRRVFAATGGRPFDAAKPVVVFIHGAGMDHTPWQLVARWFAWHGHGVLAVDLPGHGRSQGPPLPSIAGMAHWIGALLDAAGVTRAALIGHSMGGAIAVEAAAARHDRITRLALLGTAAAIPVNAELLKAARETPTAAYLMMTSWAHARRARTGGHPAPGLWMTGGTLALLAKNAPGVLLADLEACQAWKGGPTAAARIRCPTLVIMGAGDIMTPAKSGRELARLITGSQSVTIPACGHMLLAEAPDGVLDALIAEFAPPKTASFAQASDR
jgi:pimeloyl-ACP methyl ester carboxylesterase